MKAKKLLMLVLDIIIVAILAMSLMAKTTEKKTALAAGKTLLAENTDLSFNLIPDPEEKYVKAGDTVEITLSVKDINIGEEGLNSIVGYLGYDENVFDSMSIEGVGEASDPNKWNIELNQIKTHDMYGKFCIYTMQEGVTEDQAVVKMVVKLKDDLKPQRTEITFTELASSDGEVEVPEEDRKVVLIIVEDEPDVPDVPDVPEEKVVPSKEVKTGDNVVFMIGILFVATLTIMLNLLVFSKGKNKKILGMFAVLFVGLTCAGIISKAAIDVNAFRRENEYTQNWLNSDKYLVTDEIISRIEPLKNVDEIADKYNKSVVVKKDGEQVESGIVGTGMKVYLQNQTKEDAESDFSENYEYEVSVWGDTNGDGKSNQVELTRIIRNIVDDSKWKLEGAKFYSADMKIDNAIDEEDRDASVMYIVYGNQEIAGFDKVVEPKLQIIEGTFDEELGCYTSDVKVKITEQDMNGTKTKYKVENSEGRAVPFTEMNRIEEDGQITDTITLPAGEIYKVSAYTYGKEGNRSEIPYIIVDGVMFNITYTNTKDATVVENKTNQSTYTTGITPFDIYNLNDVRGYEFLGWTLDKVEGEQQPESTPSKNTEVARGQKGDLEYKANWKLIDYDITYELDGGENHPDNPSIHNIEDPDIPLGDPTRPGNTFDHWIQTPDPETGHPNIIPGHTIGEITLTAVWKYNITYVNTKNASIVDNQTNPSKYLTEQTPFDIHNLNNVDGYEFKGWTLTKIGNEAQTPGEPSKNTKVAEGQKENLEFTANWEEIVAPNTYDVTGEVIGGHGTIEGVPQNDIPEGGNTEEDIILTADEGEVSGYTLNTLRLYSGDEIDGTYSATDTDGIDYKGEIVRYRQNGRTKYLVNPIEDIHANKHLVATFKEADVVAQIVGMPDESLDEYSPRGYKIKGHKYETLKDALEDAELVNLKRENDGLPRGGTVEILILKDIDGEKNEVHGKNDVTINLDSHTISLEDPVYNAITVENDGRLTILDRSDDQKGKVVNTQGTPIRVNVGGELTLGENDNILDEMPSQTCPTIEGDVCLTIDGDEGNHGTVNFYDGQLVTPEAPIYSGYVSEINTPDSCAVTSEEIKNDDDEVIGVRAILQVLEGYEAIIENNQMRYTTLEAAFTAANNNDNFTIDNPARIKVISDHPVELETACTVQNNKKVILDINGREIRPSDSMVVNGSMFSVYLNGVLEVKDSTGEPDAGKTYASVVNDDEDYYFVTGPGYLQPNNMDKLGTRAKSHIKIDLTGPNYNAGETYELEMDFFKYATSDLGFCAMITDSENHPVLDGTGNGYLYSEKNTTGTPPDNHIVKQNLQGGQVYYLHLDYETRGVNDPLRIYGLTVDGQDILRDVIKPKGKIICTGRNIFALGGDVVINNAYVERTDYNSNVYNSILSTSSTNAKSFTIKKGVIVGNPSSSFGSLGELNAEGGTIIGSISSDHVNSTNNYTKNVNISGTAMVNVVDAHNINISGGWARSVDLLSDDSDKVTMEDGYVGGLQAKDVTTTGGYINGLVLEGQTAQATLTDTKIKAISSYHPMAGDHSVTLNNCEVDSIRYDLDHPFTLNFNNSKANSIYSNSETSVNTSQINLNISSGEVVNENGYAIGASSNAIVTLGSKNTESGDTMTVDSPIIKGKSVGIQGPASGNAVVKFYDGTIIAPEGKGLYRVTTTEVEHDNELGSDYEIMESVYEEDDTLHKWYLGHNLTAVARIRKTDAGVNVEGINRSLYNDDGVFYNFTSFDVALSACGDNSTENPTKIELLENIDIATQEEIAAGKNIEVDLAGNTFKVGKITNNGTFTVSDSVGGGSTNVTSGIVNNNKFTFNNTGANTAAITNNKDMFINGGTYSQAFTGNDNSTLTVTAGAFNRSSNAIVSSGDVIFDQEDGKTISVTTVSVTKGNLTVDGGRFITSISYTSTESGTKASISNANITNGNGRAGTFTIGAGSVAEITNTKAYTVDNNGTLTLTGSSDSTNNFTTLKNNNGGTITCEGGILTAGLSNNKGATFIVKESCTSCVLNSNSQAGHMILGENNGTIDRDKIVINGRATTISGVTTYDFNNTGTIDFYDGKIKGYIVAGSNSVINTPAGYEVQEREEDGTIYSSIYPYEYVVEVPASSVDTNAISTLSIPNEQRDGNYYFYDIGNAAKAIKDNVDTTVKYTKDKVYYTEKDQDVIGANKKITLDLNGHRVTYGCFEKTDYAIENNGELTIKDSTSTNGEIVTTSNLIDNKNKLTIENGKYGRTTSTLRDRAANGAYTVLQNTGNATIKSAVAIENNSSANTIVNNDDGYMTFEMNNPVGTVVNNTTEGNNNAGMKITGNLNANITNTQGNMWIENTTDTDGSVTGAGDVYTNNATLTGIKCKNVTVENTTVSGGINFTNNVLFKDSTASEIRSGTSTDAVARIESGTVAKVIVSKGTVYLGKETDAYSVTDAKIQGVGTNEYKSGISADTLYFYSGSINGTNQTSSSPTSWAILGIDKVTNVILPDTADMNKVYTTEDDTKYTITLKAKEPEARFNGTDYPTLKNAVAAAQGTTNGIVELLKDVDITTGREVENSGTITLKLNNHTIRNYVDNSFTNSGTLNLELSDGNIGTIENTGTINVTQAAQTNEDTSIINRINSTRGFVNINDVVTKLTIYGYDSDIIVDNSEVSYIQTARDLASPDNGEDGIGDLQITNNSKVGKIFVNYTKVKVIDSTVDDASIWASTSDTIANSNFDTMYISCKDENPVVIDSCTIESSKCVQASSACVDVNGIVKFEDCTINNTGSNYGMQIEDGSKVYVSGGSISSAQGSAVWLKGQILSGHSSALYLGEDDNHVDSRPVIDGNRYGIVKQTKNNIQEGGTSIYFYDGVIKGGTAALKGISGSSYNDAARINFVPSKMYTTKKFAKGEEGGEADREVIRLVLKGSYTPVLRVGSQTYKNETSLILSAFQEAISNNVTVTVESDFALQEPITILSGYGTDTVVTLDLQGHTIEGYSDDSALINSTVKLKVIDSVGGGKIENYGEGDAYSGDVEYLTN